MNEEPLFDMDYDEYAEERKGKRNVFEVIVLLQLFMSL